MLQIDTASLSGTALKPATRQAANDGGGPHLAPLYAPFPQHLGVEVIEATPARVRTRMTVRAEFCRTGGTMHGGPIMSFADVTGSIAAFLNLPEGCATTTIESKTNFLSAAKEGAVIEAETVPFHVGRRSSVWQTQVKHENGKLIAVITQTQMVLEKS
jgi:uncharacterized protein (TIGR00369 family)